MEKLSRQQPVDDSWGCLHSQKKRNRRTLAILILSLSAMQKEIYFRCFGIEINQKLSYKRVHRYFSEEGWCSENSWLFGTWKYDLGRHSKRVWMSFWLKLDDTPSDDTIISTDSSCSRGNIPNGIYFNGSIMRSTTKEYTTNWNKLQVEIVTNIIGFSNADASESHREQRWYIFNLVEGFKFHQWRHSWMTIQSSHPKNLQLARY